MAGGRQERTGSRAEGGGPHPKGRNEEKDLRPSLKLRPRPVTLIVGFNPAAAGLKGSDAHPPERCRRPTPSRLRAMSAVGRLPDAASVGRYPNGLRRERGLVSRQANRTRSRDQRETPCLSTTYRPKLIRTANVRDAPQSTSGAPGVPLSKSREGSILIMRSKSAASIAGASHGDPITQPHSQANRCP